MAETVFYENNLFYYGFLLAGVLAASFSQVLLKKGAMRTWSSFIREYLNPWVIGGYFLLLGSTALNICGLRGLSFLNGRGDGILRLCIRSFSQPPVFRKRIAKRKLAGAGYILAGMLIYYL